MVMAVVGMTVKGLLPTLLPFLARGVSGLTGAGASRPLGHRHMPAQHVTVKGGMVMVGRSSVPVHRMDELVFVKRNGRLGEIVRRRDGTAAPPPAPASAATPVPTRRVVHNHYGAVNFTAWTAGLAAGLSAAACTAAAAATAWAHAAPVRMLLLLLRMGVMVVVVVVGGLAVFVLGEHRCRG